MRRLFGFLGFLALCAVSFTAPQALVPIVAGSTHTQPAYTGPCDTITGCAAAYSMTRGMTAAYAGNLFQLYNGSTTLNVGMSNHVVDTSGIAAFCAGQTCLISKIYDQIHSADLVPVTSANSSGSSAPAVCKAGSGNVCAAPYWVDPSTGLPAAVTVYPSEYDVASTGINGGANPTSVYYYGRNELYPAEFGVGHDPLVANVNGRNLITVTDFTNRRINSNYFGCALIGDQCIGADEETSAEPYTVSQAPGAIGAAYASNTNGDVHVMLTWDGVNTVKGYAESATARYTTTPPSSVQFDSSPLLPGTHVKLGCGGDCVQSTIIFREGLIANATLTGTDYTNLSSNVDAFYAGHTASAACRGSADVDYSMPINAFAFANWSVFEPGASAFGAWGLAQLRASYFGPIADLNNGTTTQSFTGALAAGSAGCGLDPAAVTFCTAGSLGHCEVATLYNQGSWSSAGLGNVHDTATDLVCGSGARPTVTFNSLNGLPTMHFAGSQKCATSGPNTSIAGYFGYGVIGKRASGAAGSVANLAQFDGSIQLFWPSTASTFGFYNGAVGTEIATDDHWHYLYMENPAGSWKPSVDGSSGTPFGSATSSINFASISIGEKTDGSQGCTCDVAEIHALTIQSGAAAGYTAKAAAMFSLMQTRWGTLPN